MPATFKNCPKYIAPDGVEFETLKEEQRHEIAALFPNQQDSATCGAKDVAAFIVENGKTIRDILSQRERKRQSPERKAKRTRKTAEPATA